MCCNGLLPTNACRFTKKKRKEIVKLPFRCFENKDISDDFETWDKVHKCSRLLSICPTLHLNFFSVPRYSRCLFS